VVKLLIKIRKIILIKRKISSNL